VPQPHGKVLAVAFFREERTEMSDFAPVDETISIADLTKDPYPIYRRLRAEAPVLRVKSVGRTLLTKAEDTKQVKDNPEIFSSNDPNTPMQRAFRAHTLPPDCWRIP